MEQEKLEIGKKLKETHACEACKNQIPEGEHYTYKGKKGKDVHYCPACKEKLNESYSQEMKNPNIFGAIGLGLLAGGVAGLLWWLIVITTKYEFGYAALGVGYLVGLGVYWGSGKKRGTTLQIMSVVITLCTLLISEFFVVAYFLKGELLVATDPEVTALAQRAPMLLLENLDMLFKAIISPIGLLIWGIGLYVSSVVTKPRAI